jgi:hypothetical protein
MHDWVLIFGTGADAAGQSRDEILWCTICGTVRHDYSHNGGRKSPNYPQIHRPKTGKPCDQQDDQ